MMADPAWTGAVVVALPEELSVEETLELVPRISERMGRPPLALLVNRSVGTTDTGASRAGLAALRERLSPVARRGLDTVCADFDARRRFEAALRARLAGSTERGVVTLKERLAMPGEHSPVAIVRQLGTELASGLGRGA